MDITNFIEWFIQQVIQIFSKTFNILDNIQFSGTSILKLIITIIIISTLIPVILTISRDVSVIGQRSERVKENKKWSEYRQEKLRYYRSRR